MAKSDMNALRAAVTDMDCLAQAALNEIASITRMSLAWLETPDGQRHTEILADALNNIWYRAQNAAENIGFEADRVGCAFEDEAQKRRCRAADSLRHQLKDAGGESHA